MDTNPRPLRTTDKPIPPGDFVNRPAVDHRRPSTLARIFWGTLLALVLALIVAAIYLFAAFLFAHPLVAGVFVMLMVGVVFLALTSDDGGF